MAICKQLQIAELLLLHSQHHLEGMPGFYTFDIYRCKKTLSTLQTIQGKASFNAVAVRLIKSFLESILMTDCSPWMAVLEDGKCCHFSCLAGPLLLLLQLGSATLCLGCGITSLCSVVLRFSRGETERVQDCIMAVLILLGRVSALPQSASCCWEN